jgi:hypothetical protein
MILRNDAITHDRPRRLMTSSPVMSVITHVINQNGFMDFREI